MKLFIGCSSSKSVTKESYLSSLDLFSSLAEMEEVELILGGYSDGLMELAYHTFLDHGKEVTLVLDEAYQEEDIPAHQVLVTKTTMERTKTCYQESDMALFLNGGIGSCAEIFSFIEEKRTRKDYQYPIYLYNEDHSFDSMLALLKDMVRRKTATEGDAFSLVNETKKKEAIFEGIANLQQTKKGRGVR